MASSLSRALEWKKMIVMVRGLVSGLVVCVVIGLVVGLVVGLDEVGYVDDY